MTDTPDPSRLLASAALDNEVTADERAQVDASDSLTAELATYRALRRDLAEVDVPADAREAGIAAALAIFDAAMIDSSSIDTGRIDAAVIDSSSIDVNANDVNENDANVNDAATRSNVVSMQTRRRQQFRWLVGVAAAAIVAVVGIVVVNTNSSTGKNLTSTAEPAPRAGSASSNEKSSDQSGKQPAATSAIDSAAGGAPAGPGADSVNGTTAATGPVAATAVIDPSAGAASAPAVGTDPWVGAPSFDGAAALAAFAFAPGSPLSQTSAATSAHPTAVSTAVSTAGSTGGATASTPAFPVFVTTTSTAGAPATTAAASATTAAATPAAGAATPPPQPVDSILIEHADAVCNTRGHPTIAAIYVGKRVIIVRDDVTNQLQILDPQTCAITSTIAVP